MMRLLALPQLRAQPPAVTNQYYQRYEAWHAASSGQRAAEGHKDLNATDSKNHWHGAPTSPFASSSGSAENLLTAHMAHQLGNTPMHAREANLQSHMSTAKLQRAGT